MDLHHNIWLILLLSLPSQDIILGPGMQLCWCQPRHSTYPHLVTEPFSCLLRNCGTVFRRKSETFRPSHLLCAYENICIVYAQYKFYIYYYYLLMSIEVSQHNNNVLFGKLTNFVKNQLKVLKEIIKGNTVTIRWPVTNPTGNIKVFDAEFNPKKFNGGKFQI